MRNAPQTHPEIEEAHNKNSKSNQQVFTEYKELLNQRERSDKLFATSVQNSNFNEAQALISKISKSAALDLLFDAISNKELDKVGFLLQLDCSADEHRGQYALHRAIMAGDPEMIDQVAQFKPELFKKKNLANQTPFSLATDRFERSRTAENEAIIRSLMWSGYTPDENIPASLQEKIKIWCEQYIEYQQYVTDIRSLGDQQTPVSIEKYLRITAERSNEETNVNDLSHSLEKLNLDGAASPSPRKFSPI